METMTSELSQELPVKTANVEVEPEPGPNAQNAQIFIVKESDLIF